MNKTGLTFDDIFLIPQYSTCTSRSELDTSVEFGNFKIRSPIISSNMDTVTESRMAIAMWRSGAIGGIHRFMSTEEAVKEYRNVRDANCDSFVSIGVKHEDIDRATKLHAAGATLFIVDIAHGHSSQMRQMLSVLRNTFGTNIYIVAGNIATATAVYDLAKWGADCVKVGIGSGACCKTRVVTGHGVPMFSCLLECCEAADAVHIKAIADGGIRSSGDVVKAMAAGADMVMLGSMLSGVKETPGRTVLHDGKQYKEFRGMASSSAMESRYKNKKDNLSTPEGIAGRVLIKGVVSEIIKEITSGLRSGMSYSGASVLNDLHLKANWSTQTFNGIIEGKPRLEEI